MSKEDEYRRNAAEAERQAQRAGREEDRAAWLRLAQGWRGLLSWRTRNGKGSFGDHVTQ
jgi:hypothetical protein